MKLLITLFFGFLSHSVFSQSLTPEVIGSTGDHFAVGSSQLSWTIGEIMIETYSPGGNGLTQGFHQTNIYVTSLNNQNIIQLSVFPNPVLNEVTIEIPNNEYLELTLFDCNGKLVNKVESDNINSTVQIDISDLASGIYLLQVYNPVKQIYSSYKIFKAQ